MKTPNRKKSITRFWPVLLLVVGAALGVAIAKTKMLPAEAAPALVPPVVNEAIGTGTIESESQVNVAFTLPGRLAKVLVHEGQLIKQGETLAELDPEERQKHLTSAKRGVDLAQTAILKAEADIARARVTLDAALREKKRTESLFTSGVATEVERDNAVEKADRAAAELQMAIAAKKQGSGTVQAARAMVAIEDHRSGETTVISPVDGVVVKRVREPGDVVGAGQPILVVASTRKVWARTWMDETVIARLSEGQSATVTLRGNPTEPLVAKVDRIAVEADRQTHEILVDLQLVQLPQRLVFGQRADATVTLVASK
ncbi:MAG: efflux RND transporter periplasmic adaptor subunit [Polyangiaceae bacterium]|nr:efflux RND transporter periplasmic adaptor subunit [Polyangiaceae bacterium]